MPDTVVYRRHNPITHVTVGGNQARSDARSEFKILEPSPKGGVKLVVSELRRDFLTSVGITATPLPSCKITLASFVKSISKNRSLGNFIRGIPPRPNKIKSSEVHR